jgi:hypothetical protein
LREQSGVAVLAAVGTVAVCFSFVSFINRSEKVASAAATEMP